MALYAELQKAMALSDADRQRVLDRVHGITQTQNDFRPAAATWSVGEVLHHLILIEVSISKLFNKLNKENQRVVGATEAIRAEDMVYPSELRWQHPVFGDIGLAHWVRFIGLHEGHHAQHIECIMAAPGFPR